MEQNIDYDDIMWNTWTSAVQNKKQAAFDNFLLSLHERRVKKVQIRSKPYRLFLDPTSFCNLQCPLCPTGLRNGSRESSKMTMDNFRHVMDHLGPYVFELTLFNWGEPFLHDRIAEMIRIAKGHDMAVTVSSNMSVNLTEEKVREIIRAGLDYLICSIDGVSQETYEKYRVGGSFSLAMKNMEMFNRIRRSEKTALHTPRITWQFLVFRHNQHEIDAVRKKAAEMGVGLNVSKAFAPPEWRSTLPEYSLNPHQSGSVEMEHTDRPKPSSNTDGKGFPADAVEMEHTDRPKPSASHSNLLETQSQLKPCTWLWSAMTINANMSVSPCCAVANQSDDFGRIQNDVDTFYNSEKFTKSRELFSDPRIQTDTLCGRCPHPETFRQEIRGADAQIATAMWSRTDDGDRARCRDMIMESDPELLDAVPEIKNWAGGS